VLDPVVHGYPELVIDVGIRSTLITRKLNHLLGRRRKAKCGGLARYLRLYRAEKV
jgi:hypothetical protein